MPYFNSNYQKVSRDSSNTRLSASRLKLITEQLEPHLSQVFGYHALLYTPLAYDICHSSLVINNQVIIAEPLLDHRKQNNPVSTSNLSLFCRFNALPISSDTIDLAVLPNILQNVENPHQVLREVERILIPEGVVILIGRNPLSLQGIKTGYRRWRQNIRSKHVVIDKKVTAGDIGKGRIKDWFDLLGLETEKQINISLTNHKIQNSQLYPWLKKCAEYFCDYFCSYYIIIATKKVSTLTPIRASWRSNKRLVPSRLAEPSVRTQLERWFEQK